MGLFGIVQQRRWRAKLRVPSAGDRVPSIEILNIERRTSERREGGPCARVREGDVQEEAGNAWLGKVRSRSLPNAAAGYCATPRRREAEGESGSVRSPKTRDERRSSLGCPGGAGDRCASAMDELRDCWAGGVLSKRPEVNQAVCAAGSVFWNTRSRQSWQIECSDVRLLQGRLEVGYGRTRRRRRLWGYYGVPLAVTLRLYPYESFAFSAETASGRLEGQSRGETIGWWSFVVGVSGQLAWPGGAFRWMRRGACLAAAAIDQTTSDGAVDAGVRALGEQARVD